MGLSKFEVRGDRAMIGNPMTTRSLQEVENNLSIDYIDSQSVTRNIKIQVHGAATIYGEGVKAKEVLNLILDFKHLFIDKNKTNSENTSDPVVALKKLQELKDLGLITDSEYNSKKEEILKNMV